MKRREALFATLASLAVTGVRAQTFPDRAIRVINPFASGTAIEALGRVLEHQIEPLWKQPLVIESKSGAGGLVGAGMVAHAPADGYTLMVTSHSPITVAPILNPKGLNYDPIDDLAPLWGVSSTGTLIAVTNSLPVKTLQELVEYSKRNPDKVSYASSGVGSTMHLAAEQFISLSGARMIHVPYRGAAPAATDVIGGQVQVLFDGAVNQIQNVKGARLRPLAIIGDSRHPDFTDVPTVQELGLKQLTNRSFFGFFAPRKSMPPALLAKLRADVSRTMNSPEALKQLQSAGLAGRAMTAQELERRIPQDLQATRDIVKAANIKVES